MNKFPELVFGFISLMAILDCLPHPSMAQEESDLQDEPTLSALASKMRGVCARPQIVEEYITNCNNSSISIQPDTEISPRPSKFPVNAVLKIKKQNELLLQALISHAIYNKTTPKHQPKFGLELTSAAFLIYGQVCPAVPTTFLQTVVYLFKYLHYKTSSRNRREFLPKPQQHWIATLIKNCTKTVLGKAPSIFTDTCKETVLSVKNCSTFICTEPEYEFRLLRTDPIVDVVFKAMEIVQSICFPVFTQSYRMFHLFHLAIMDTFTEAIRTRWNTQLEDSGFWQRLLGPSFDTHLINLERCNEGIIANNEFHYRIPRESLPSRIRLSGAIRPKNRKRNITKPAIAMKKRKNDRKPKKSYKIL